MKGRDHALSRGKIHRIRGRALPHQKWVDPLTKWTSVTCITTKSPLTKHWHKAIFTKTLGWPSYSNKRMLKHLALGWQLLNKNSKMICFRAKCLKWRPCSRTQWLDKNLLLTIKVPSCSRMLMAWVCRVKTEECKTYSRSNLKIGRSLVNSARDRMRTSTWPSVNCNYQRTSSFRSSWLKVKGIR